VHWDELEKGLTPDKFNLQNMRKRLEKEGDIWQGIFDSRVDMGSILESMKNQ
jgi:DNA primase